MASDTVEFPRKHPKVSCFLRTRSTIVLFLGNWSVTRQWLWYTERDLQLCWFLATGLSQGSKCYIHSFYLITPGYIVPWAWCWPVGSHNTPAPAPTGLVFTNEPTIKMGVGSLNSWLVIDWRSCLIPNPEGWIVHETRQVSHSNGYYL